MESVASETVDSTLIVNGTSSSQEEAEISATYSWSHSPERDHVVATIQQLFKILAAATRIQKHYRGFRTRRNLADSIIAAELLWQTTLFHIQKVGKLAITVNIESEKHIGSLLEWLDTRFKKYGMLSSDQLALLHCWETIDPRLRYSCNSHFFYLIWGDQCFLGSSKFDSYKIGDLKRRESLLTAGKPTSVQLIRMNTASSTQHGISDLTRAWKTWKGALQQWLEVIDPRHRAGRNLSFYFQKWMISGGGQPFFYWLDVGDGKTVEHLECSREKLRHERNTYLELVSKSEAVESLMSLVLRSESNTEKDINNNQREHGRADEFNQQASNSEVVEPPAPLMPSKGSIEKNLLCYEPSEVVEPPASLMPRSESDTEEDINSNQREHGRADGFDQQASKSKAVEDDDTIEIIVPTKDDLENNQGTIDEPADGFNQKDLWRRIFYAMNLLFEIATAILEYLSSQQRQPRYALSGMILSITVMAISLIQLGYTVGKEVVSSQWKGWIPWLFGNPVQVLELLLSVSQCVFAIIAYHYLSRDQNNPAQFSAYPIAFAFCLLCLSFRRRET